MAFVNITNQALKAKGLGLYSLRDGIYIAIGRGDNSWDVELVENKTFAGNVISTAPNLGTVSVKSQDLQTIYTKNVDYFVNTVNGQITRLAGGNIPNNATVNVTYSVLGKFSLNSTQLFDEIGRRKTVVNYLVLDPDGEVELDSIKYSNSPTPTRLIHIKTTFSTIEAQGETAREYGLFFDTVPVGVEATVEKTFVNSQVILIPGIRNVIVKSEDSLTTYLEDIDYSVNYSTGMLFRLSSGAIPNASTVNVTYKSDPQDYIEFADVEKQGFLYTGATFPTVDRDSKGNWLVNFLISIAE
jgi:hypothetical protein